MLDPGEPWQTFTHDGAVGRIIYRIRVRCDENYYSNKCNKLCVPRDDYFGHYRCEASGAQVCLDGWMGADCRTGALTTPQLITTQRREFCSASFSSCSFHRYFSSFFGNCFYVQHRLKFLHLQITEKNHLWFLFETLLFP